MHSIKTKYLLRIISFLVFMFGSMILIYTLLADEYYVSENKKVMNKIYGEMKQMNLKKLSNKEKSALESYNDMGFTIIIQNEEKKVIYSTIKRKKVEKSTIGLLDSEEHTFEEDATAYRGKSGNNIKLYGLIEEEGVKYPITIKINISTLDNVVATMRNFFIFEMIAMLLVGIVFSFVLANVTTKPIEKLNDMAKKMAQNDVSVEEYRYPNDEIGILALNIIDMYNKLSNNLNELDNYNYMLKSKNRGIIEFNERRKDFINTATHELKTPLAIISSQVEMLNLEHSEQMSEYYNSIMEEIQKMSEMIRKMLNQSFGDEITPEKEKYEVLSLSELIKSNEQKYRTLFSTKSIKCSFNVEDGVYVNMNSENIVHALNNYVINAFEHTEKNHKVVIALEKSQGRAIISVFNEGVQIPENKMDEIWNSYYRIQHSEHDANVGLGLYIVADIVSAHNGKCYAVNGKTGVKFVMEFDAVTV